MSLCIPKRLKGHPARRRSRQQEKDIAKRIGGHATLASGALDVKGDVRKRKVIRIEAKTTTKDSFRVTKETIRKIEDAALASDEMPAIEVEFLDGAGKPVMSVAVVPTYVLELIGLIMEEKQ